MKALLVFLAAAVLTTQAQASNCKYSLGYAQDLFGKVIKINDLDDQSLDILESKNYKLASVYDADLIMSIETTRDVRSFFKPYGHTAMVVFKYAISKKIKVRGPGGYSDGPEISIIDALNSLPPCIVSNIIK